MLLHFIKKAPETENKVKREKLKWQQNDKMYVCVCAFKIFLKTYFLHVQSFCLHACLRLIHTWGPKRSEENAGSPETGLQNLVVNHHMWAGN